MVSENADSTVVKRSPDVLLITGIAILLGLLANTFFFDQPLGISAPIFVFLSLFSLYGLAYHRGVQPTRRNSWLALALAFFALMVAVRAESFTTFLNVGVVFLLTLLLAHVFTGRNVLDFGLADYIGSVIVSAFEILFIKPPTELAAASKFRKGGVPPHLAAVLRGLMLAIPVLLVFILLLSSADAAFKSLIEDILDLLRLENLSEFITRLIFSAIVAWGMLGGLAYALRPLVERKSAVSSFLSRAPLGITEAAVVLGSVNLLFAVFVGVQFRYFFGGQSNVHVAGLTYAEYARRGFAELVLVAIFSLGLALLLQRLTKRESRRAALTFEVLAGLLAVLTGVILISAFQRLLLYEQAYGFTELRFFTHVFMGWMGVLLAIFLVSLHFDRPRWFAAGLLLVGLGFIFTLNVLNTDAFIVRQNMARYEASGDLDAVYLATLSEDAIPGLLQALSQVGPDEKQILGSALHFQLNQLEEDESEAGWFTWHYARSRAYALLSAARAELEQYEPYEYYWEFPVD